MGNARTRPSPVISTPVHPHACGERNPERSPRRESAQQLGVAQLAALVVVEQVATHHTAGALVALHPDESNQRVCGRFDFSGRDCTPQRCRCTIPGLRLTPRALLRGMVVCQSERHQLVEVDALPPVQGQQLRAWPFTPSATRTFCEKVDSGSWYRTS